MERKEYPIPTISGEATSLELLDGDGNPFKPSEPVNYKIIGEDGTTLKEGSIEDDNIISLENLPTRKFRVVVDSYVVAETEGFEQIGVDKESEEGEEGPSENHQEESSGGEAENEEEAPSDSGTESGDWIEGEEPEERNEEGDADEET